MADVLCVGAVSEQLNDTDRANAAYEHALRHNPTSVSALTQVAGMARVKEDFHKVCLSPHPLPVPRADVLDGRPWTTTNAS